MKSVILNVCFLGGAAVLFVGLWWCSPSLALVAVGVGAMTLGIAGHIRGAK